MTPVDAAVYLVAGWVGLEIGRACDRWWHRRAPAPLPALLVDDWPAFPVEPTMAPATSAEGQQTGVLYPREPHAFGVPPPPNAVYDPATDTFLVSGHRICGAAWRAGTTAQRAAALALARAHPAESRAHLDALANACDFPGWDAVAQQQREVDLRAVQIDYATRLQQASLEYDATVARQQAYAARATAIGPARVYLGGDD